MVRRCRIGMDFAPFRFFCKEKTVMCTVIHLLSKKVTFASDIRLRAPSRGVAGIVAVIDDAAKVAARKPVDTDSEAHRIGNDINMARGIISDKHASKWFGGAELGGQNIGKIAYNVLMSMGDSASVTAMTGILGAPRAASILMGSSAAADAIVENKRRGMSDEKALAQGFSTGAIEMLTEKISLERIMKEPKTVIKGLLKGFVSEGSEEIASNVLNKTMDAMFNGDDAQIRIAIKNYISDGFSKKDAIKMAVADSLTDDAIAGIAGGFSGVAMSGVYRGINAARIKSAGAEIRKSGQVNTVIEQGLSLDESSEAYKNADKMARDIKSGKAPSDVEIGRLCADVASAAQNDIRYKIQENEKGRYVQADRQVIKGNKPGAWQSQIKKYIDENIRHGRDVNVIASDGDILTITRDTSGKARFRNSVTLPDGTQREMTNREFKAKLNAEGHIDEISAVSKRGKYVSPDTKDHPFAKDGFNYRTAFFQDFDGKYYKLTLSVGKNGEINTVYNIGRMDGMRNPSDNSENLNQKKETPFSSRFKDQEGIITDGTNTRVLEVSSDTNIPQNETDVNRNFIKKGEKNAREIKKIPFPGQTVAPKDVTGYKADSGIQSAVDSEAVTGSKTVSESKENPLSPIRALNNQFAREEKVSSDTNIPQNAADVNSNFIRNSGEVFGAARTEAAQRFRGVRPRYFEVIDGISKKLSITSVIDENIEGKDGYWNPRTRELHINANAQNPVSVILKHEITHVLEGNSQYGELIDFMKSSFADDWLSRRQSIADTYERINMRKSESERIDISDSMLDSETMAEFAQEFNTDEFIERVATQKPGMITKVRDFVRDVIERIKGVFSRKDLSPWEQAEKKWENAVRAAVNEGYNDSLNYDVKYLISSSDNADKTSIKEQINDSSDKISKMEPVFDDDVDVEHKGKSMNREWIMKELSVVGYKMVREDIGEVIFDKKRINKSLSYLKSDAELAAYSALPSVIKKGIVIATHKDHKKRGYSTVTIAAPVVINGVRGNMGVVVRQNEGNNYYKIHRILMPDGSVFVYKSKSNAETAGANKLVTSPTDVASNTNISHKRSNVNKNFDKGNPDIRYKVADPGETKDYLMNGPDTWSDERRMQYYKARKAREIEEGTYEENREKRRNLSPLEASAKAEAALTQESRNARERADSEKSLTDIFFEMSPEERKKHFGNLREDYELDTDMPEKMAEMPEDWSLEMKAAALGWRKIRERHKGKLSNEEWQHEVGQARDFMRERALEQERYENAVDSLKKKIVGDDINAAGEIENLRSLQNKKDYKKAAAAANALLKKLQSSGNAAATPDVIDYLDAQTQFEIFLNRADALVDNQLDDLEKRKPSLAKEIRAEAEDARKLVRRVWGDNAAAKSKGEEFEMIKHQMEGEDIPDGTPKRLLRKSPPKKKSALDHVYDKYKIKHIDTVDMQRARETLDVINGLNSKEDLINLIIKQSKERKTQVHGIKKALQGQEIVFLKDIAVQQLFNTITDAEGVSVGRKISTYQTMSHLLNGRTMTGNITSNTAFSGTNTVASWVAAPVDKLMSIFTRKRTVGAEKVSLSNYKAGAQRAATQYIDIALAVDHSGKGKYDINSAVRTFQNKSLGTFERAMGYGLQVTDEWQKGIAEDRVRKSLEKLKNCGFTDKEITEIAEYEAKYRTFQDTTAPSQFMTKLKEAFNVIGIKDFGLGDIIQKYTQVPGAIISRSAEFTPLGYIKALNGISKVALRKNEMTAAMQRNIAMSIGRATTGTGLIMLFSVLSKLGIFVGDDSDDDSKQLQKLKKAEGISGFQINLSALERLAKREDPKLKKGDLLESIGFLEPLNVEMAIGYELSKGKDFGIKNWADICSAQVFEQIAEIPAMQSLRNFQNTIDYGGNCVDIAIGILASGATGFIPSVVRQTGNFLDPIQRNPYKEGTPLNKGIEQIKATIPFMRKSVPASITPYGEEKQAAKGFFNNFVNRGYMTVYQPGDISEELYRMAEVSSDVLPHVPASKFTIDGREFKLYGHDYEEYSKAVGKRTHVLLKGAIEHGDYANLSDEDKAAVLASLANTAEKEAQDAYSNRNLKEVQNNADAAAAAIAVVGQKKFREMSDRFSSGENISAVLDGTAKHDDKTSRSQEQRVHDYFVAKLSKGEITKQEARRQFNAYLDGNLEMPVFEAYTEEKRTYSQLTSKQRRAKDEAMQKKEKSGEISAEEYAKWWDDFSHDRIEVEVRNYVFDTYSDCDDSMKKKLQKKLQKRAFEEAEREVGKQQ